MACAVGTHLGTRDVRPLGYRDVGIAATLDSFHAHLAAPWVTAAPHIQPGIDVFYLLRGTDAICAASEAVRNIADGAP